MMVTEENLNYRKNETSETEGVNEDDETIKTSRNKTSTRKIAKFIQKIFLI